MSESNSMTRRGLLGRALGTAAFDPDDPLQAQASSPPARVRDSFDFGWKFFKGDAPGARQPAFADAAWRNLDLPHDWSIEGPFTEKEPSSGAGGYAPTGIGWYRKRFRVPASFKDRIVTIEFDGVYQNSEVWINGHYPDAANEIAFDVAGEGRLIGVDNGNPADLQDFKGKVRTAYNGMCLAIVQSTAAAGVIRLTATSPGLKPATVTVATRAS